MYVVCVVSSVIILPCGIVIQVHTMEKSTTSTKFELGSRASVGSPTRQTLVSSLLGDDIPEMVTYPRGLLESACGISVDQ